MAKKNPLHNAAGKKILHPADAQRKKFKKQKLEKMKKERQQNFETKMFGKSPEEIEHEIMAMKFDHERKRAHKIEISKIQQDRLTKLEAGYKKLKEEIDARHKKRQAAPKSNLHVDFEELKVHRKSSIFYHPVTNPYGAPPNGQTLMYRHPDGSVKREPPPVAEDERPEAPGFGGASSSSAAGPARRPPGFGSEDEDDEDEDGDEDEEGGGVVIAGAGASEDEDDEDDDEDEDAEPMLPTVLPDGSSLPTLPPGPPPGTRAAGLPPLPPGPPPGSSGRLPAGMPPLPPGQPPLPPGQPPLPPGMPPLPPGMPPLPAGMPPLPAGMPPLPAGMPPLPVGMPPLPLGMPPLPAGMPPLPAGMPPLPAGMPPLPLGQPPLPFGQPHAASRLQPKLPPGMPPLPAGIPPLGPPPDMDAVLGAGPKSGGAPAPGSQAAFIAELQQAGVQLPPGTSPPLPPGGPPGPPPKAAAGAGLEGKAAPPGPPPKAPPKAEPPTVSDLPAGVKAPPPPPKKPAVAASAQASGPGVSRAATAFVPTALRTKRASAVAGGVLQVSSASLSLEKRQRTLFTEAPKVTEKINMDDAFEDFMKEIG